ncbi:MAG: thioredoxin family protein [Chlamydiae bacterium]|nr:thioredoxin family protein [Chlamydiota bacterium]
MKRLILLYFFFFSWARGYSASLPDRDLNDQIIDSFDQKLSLQERNDAWLQNYGKVMELARDKNKPILMALLGTDWCVWSKKMDSEVLNDQNFIDAVKKEFILLKVQFPEIASQQNGQLECEKIKEKYHVQECPLLLLVNADGAEIAKIGYIPLNAKEFASYITELFSHYHDVEEAISQENIHGLKFEELKPLYEKAKKLTDPKYVSAILTAGIEKDQNGYFIAEQYARLLTGDKLKRKQATILKKKILDKDPQNDKGAHLKIAMVDFQTLANVSKKKKKPEEVVAPLVKYLNQFGEKDKENSWKVELTIAQYLFGKNLIADALKHAKLSYENAPESAKEEISQSIQFLQTRLSNSPYAEKRIEKDERSK